MIEIAPRCSVVTAGMPAPLLRRRITRPARAMLHAQPGTTKTARRLAPSPPHAHTPPRPARPPPRRPPKPTHQGGPTTMPARTGAEFLKGLRDNRQVWFAGTRVTDPLDHPGLRGAAQAIADVYDLHFQYADDCLMPDPETAEPIAV